MTTMIATVSVDKRNVEVRQERQAMSLDCHSYPRVHFPKAPITIEIELKSFNCMVPTM